MMGAEEALEGLTQEFRDFQDRLDRRLASLLTSEEFHRKMDELTARLDTLRRSQADWEQRYGEKFGFPWDRCGREEPAYKGTFSPLIRTCK